MSGGDWAGDPKSKPDDGWLPTPFGGLGPRVYTTQELYDDLVPKYQRLVAFYDDHVGTPCEQIRHQQEIEALRREHIAHNLATDAAYAKEIAAAKVTLSLYGQSLQDREFLLAKIEAYQHELRELAEATLNVCNVLQRERDDVRGTTRGPRSGQGSGRP